MPNRYQLSLMGITFSLTSCIAVSVPPVPPTSPIPQTPTPVPQPSPQASSTQLSSSQAVRIMPLGDSITQGNRRHNSYRRSLWLKLRQAGYAVDFVGSTRSHLGGSAPNSDFDQDHEGHWGWRVGEVSGRIDQWARNAQPDIVLIHLGTNNIGARQTPQRPIRELRQIIQSLRQINPQINVLLAQLIPIEGAEAEVQQFNQEIVRLAQSTTTQQSPIIAVDQFTGFDARKDTYDGVHPNEIGEKKLADRWFTALQKLLSRNRN